MFTDPGIKEVRSKVIEKGFIESSILDVVAEEKSRLNDKEGCCDHAIGNEPKPFVGKSLKEVNETHIVNQS